MKKIKKALNKIKLHKLSQSNHGVVGIVVAVLLIGLLVSVISIIQAAYIPKWMEEREADHIEQVLVQFSELKLAIDTHSANKEENTPIATSITLGSKEFPFLMSTRAYGTLEIIDNTSDDACTISIIYYKDGNITSRDLNLGLIKYTSYNAYYIPYEQQSFIYEAGAIITSQTSGDSISIKPSFKPSDELFFKIVNVASYANKTSFGGYGEVPILTEFSGNYSITGNICYISITTSYWNAWSTFLNSTLKKQGYEYGSDYSIDSGNTIVLEMLNQPEFELTVIDISAQIGPGWVE